MKAIAALSANGVIGRDGGMPWHLPEDFRWFKRATMGGALLMGRKTFESIGRPLPGRLNLVVSRRGPIDAPGVVTLPDLEKFRPEDYAPREIWVAGGAEIFRQMLPRCEELYLSHLSREANGDTFFPEYEADFEYAETVLTFPEFEVKRYRRKGRKNSV